MEKVKKLQVPNSAVSLYLEQLITDNPWSGVVCLIYPPPILLPPPYYPPPPFHPPPWAKRR